MEKIYFSHIRPAGKQNYATPAINLKSLVMYASGKRSFRYATAFVRPTVKNLYIKSINHLEEWGSGLLLYYRHTSIYELKYFHKSFPDL